ncbi:hypothetical protein OROGR_010311 [Orobanche gracilis]
MGIVGNLNSDQLQFFNSEGYLVLESFASPDEIQSLRLKMDQLLDRFDCSSRASIFSTKNQKQTTDDYFFESAENISYFFEEKAFDDEGNLKQPKQLSINKVGHGITCSRSCAWLLRHFLDDAWRLGGLVSPLGGFASLKSSKAPNSLHEKDPVFKSFSSSEKVSSLLFSLGYRRPVIIQSMYIFKQPGIGGEVVPHQDNSFLYTNPTTCTGLWLALEDATITNGCLWAIPGSHKDGLVRRFIRDDAGVHFDKPSPLYDQKDFVPVEVKAGSLVALHGDLIHQSFENKSATSRHAYSLHVVDTDGCKWAEDNWIRRNLGPDPLYAS